MFIPTLLVSLMIVPIWLCKWAVLHRLLFALILGIFLVKVGWHHSFLFIILVLERRLIVIIADLLLWVRLVDSISIITALGVWWAYPMGTAIPSSLRRSNFLCIRWYYVFSLNYFCRHLSCCDPLTCHYRRWPEYIIVFMTLVELSVTIWVVSYPGTILSQILFHHIYTLRPRGLRFRLLILVCCFIMLLFLVSFPGTRGTSRWLQV